MVSELVGEASPRYIYDLALDDSLLAGDNTLGGNGRPTVTMGVERNAGQS